MKPGNFYCYYKPSFVNGFEQYIDKDIYFEYLQAFEGVARDEFSPNKEYLQSEEFRLLLTRTNGIQTESFANEIFDRCFSRTFNVEFVFNPNFKEFRHKYLNGAEKPMLFIYCPPLYMSRYVGEFKEVLKNYQEVFDVYYTDDTEKAGALFYVKEFPEIFPYVLIVDSKKKKILDNLYQPKTTSDALVKETISEGSEQITGEQLDSNKPASSLEAEGLLKRDEKDRQNFYFHKYREIIFFNNIQKDLNKLIDKFLDGEVHHFYQSEKTQQNTRVKKISSLTFEQEIVKNPYVTQCIVEVFKHDCPSCAFNGKVFNAFSIKLEKHGLQLPLYRLAISNKVPWLGNFGYSPIYLFIKKQGNEIVEIKTLEGPQRGDGFLTGVTQMSEIKGMEKIKIKAREQVIKHIRLEDLDEDFDIDFDVKEDLPPVDLPVAPTSTPV